MINLLVHKLKDLLWLCRVKSERLEYGGRPSLEGHLVVCCQMGMWLFVPQTFLQRNYHVQISTQTEIDNITKAEISSHLLKCFYNKWIKSLVFMNWLTNFNFHEKSPLSTHLAIFLPFSINMIKCNLPLMPAPLQICIKAVALKYDDCTCLLDVKSGRTNDWSLIFDIFIYWKDYNSWNAHYV